MSSWSRPCSRPMASACATNQSEASRNSRSSEPMPPEWGGPQARANCDARPRPAAYAGLDSALSSPRSLPMQRNLLAALVGLALAAPAFAADVAVTAGRLLDVRTGHYVEHPVIVVHDGKIASVTANGAVPAGARRVDLVGLTLVPGLIDMHVHLDSDPL